MDKGLSWVESVTLAIAILGAALGILNLWRAYSADRVRLRVRPAFAFAVPNGEPMFSIGVVNLSKFAVTVSEVGFTLGGSSIKSERAAVPMPRIKDGGNWPRRLESRESVSTYLDPASFSPNKKNIGHAYVRTSCGEVAYGTSPALKQLKSILK
jgi:hypothetical protein